MFRVTTLEPGRADVRDEDDFFGKRASLTVSGQLSAEAYACALSKVYTFGPTFRAENSNTTRHLAEFWMIEPEMAFADRDDAMDNAEAYVRHCIEQVLHRQNEELELFDRFVEKGLKRKLQATLERPFARITYTEAIAVLQASGESFEFAPHWGADLQTEHERFLAEKHFQRPVFVYDYPAAIKAFYMRLNDVDGGDGGDGREPACRTVAAFDLLVPGLGELVGGSQREERLDTLLQRMRECNLDPATYWWYVDLRRYGTVPHAGYGLGFERLVQYCTGMDNIRDVIPFARYPGHSYTHERDPRGRVGRVEGGAAPRPRRLPLRNGGVMASTGKRGVHEEFGAADEPVAAGAAVAAGDAAAAPSASIQRFSVVPLYVCVGHRWSDVRCDRRSAQYGPAGGCAHRADAAADGAGGPDERAVPDRGALCLVSVCGGGAGADPAALCAQLGATGRSGAPARLWRLVGRRTPVANAPAGTDQRQ
eukprot:ctg_3764.g406